MDVRVILMGSPEFAVPSLKALAEQYRVVLVVTQPDRRKGRGQKHGVSPVKSAALALGLEVWQPATLRTPEAIQQLRAARPDVYVTAAVGHILTPAALSIPQYGCLNVHASLLPRWRGAAPVSAAILNGDSETGITLLKTDSGVDTGPILAQVRCPIESDDTTGTLTRRLSRLGADLLIETLPRWLAGEITPRAQPAAGVTISRRLQKSDGAIDWRQPAAVIERMIRAYRPWPGTYTTYQGKRLSVLRARAIPDWANQDRPGRVISVNREAAVVTGQGVLVLDEIQLAGKRAMSPDAFCRGQRAFIGATLGG